MDADFPTSQANRDQIKTVLYKAAKQIYFGSEGRHLVERFDVYWDVLYGSGKNWATERITFNGQASSDSKARCHKVWWYTKPDCGEPWDNRGVSIPQYDWCGTTSTGLPPLCTSRAMTNYFQENVGLLILHELGHCMYGNLHDEYDYQQSGENYECGHSVMTDPGFDKNQGDFCSQINGGTDSPFQGGDQSHTHSTSQNNWACLDSTSGPLHTPIAFPQATETPDPFMPETWVRQQGGSEKPFSSVVQIVEHFPP